MINKWATKAGQIFTYSAGEVVGAYVLNMADCLLTVCRNME